MTIKENINYKKRDLKTVKKVLELAEKLSRNKILNKMECAIYSDNIALEPNGTKQFQAARKELRKMFPGYTDKNWCIDMPTRILVRYKTNVPLLDIWVTYDNESDLPEGLTNNGKCHFKEVQQIKKVFVCEKAPA